MMKLTPCLKVGMAWTEKIQFITVAATTAAHTSGVKTSPLVRWADVIFIRTARRSGLALSITSESIAKCELFISQSQKLSLNASKFFEKRIIHQS
jgi:hypothetical protein